MKAIRIYQVPTQLNKMEAERNDPTLPRVNRSREFLARNDARVTRPPAERPDLRRQARARHLSLRFHTRIGVLGQTLAHWAPLWEFWCWSGQIFLGRSHTRKKSDLSLRP